MMGYVDMEFISVKGMCLFYPLPFYLQHDTLENGVNANRKFMYSRVIASALLG